MNVSQPLRLVFLMLAIALGVPLGVTGCTLMSGLFSEEPMTAEEFEAWLPAAVDEVYSFTQAAVQEGDLAPATVAVWASSLRSIGEGGAVPSSIGSVLGLEGYEGLAVSSALSSLQARAARAGYWGDSGARAQRARVICAALGERLAPLGAG